MSAGQLNHLVVGKESTWGTAITPAKAVRVNFSGGIQTDNDPQMLAPQRATLAKNTDMFIGQRVHEGDYEMALYPDNMGYLIISALGGVASALKGGESVVYEHTLSEVEAKIPLTIEQKIGENIRRFAGAMVQSFKLSGKIGEAVMMSVALKAKSQASASAVSPTWLTSRPYNWADVVAKLGGVALANLINFEMEYNNNLEFVHSLNGSNDPAFNYVKGSEVKGKLEFYLDSTSLAELNDFLAKTSNAFDLVITGDAIGTSSNNKLELAVPKIFYTTGETPLSEDYNLLSLEFEGVYDAATSKLISGKITNLLANYN